MNEDSNNVWKIIDLVYNLEFLAFMLFFGIILFVIYLFMPDDDYYGTWEIYSVRYNNKKMSLNELIIKDKKVYDDVINNYFVLRDDGNIYFYYNNNGNLYNYEIDDKNVIFEDFYLEYKKDFLFFSYDDEYVLYYKRSSHSQKIE